MRTKTKVTLAIVLTGLVPLATAGQAIAAGEAEGAYDLGRIVVSKQAKQGVEAGETVQTVTAEQIKRQNARTLDEAVALLPGISVRTAGDGTPRIDIRGFRTRHVLLLLNGTPFNAASDGQFDPSLISVENIAEIKVVTGGTSVSYGPGGNGGVINIITKKGGTATHGSAAAEVGEGASRLIRTTVSGGSEAVDFFASASGYKRDSFPLSDDFKATKAEDGGARDNSDIERKNVFANVGYSPTDKTLLGMTFSYLNGEHGKPPVVNFDKTDPFSSNEKFDRLTDSDNYSLQLAASHDPSGPFLIKSWVFVNQLDQVEDRFDNNRYNSQRNKGSFHTDSTTRISGANLQVGYHFSDSDALTLGLMAENDDFDAAGFEQVQVNKTTVVRQSVDRSNDFQVYSTLLEYEASPLDHLGVVAGAGYHWQDREDDTKSDYSYLLSAYYDFPTDTRIRANHARKIRFPTLDDLYSPDGGNATLEAEKTMHYEIGLEQGLPAKTTVSLSGFYIDVNDFIEKDADGIKTNFQEYTFSGFETSIENRVIDDLLLRAGYTYMETEDKSAGSQRDVLQYRPRHKLTFESNYRLAWGMSLYGSLTYVADQYFYDKNQIEKKRLSDYTLVDVRLSQEFFQGKLTAYLGAKNLFDQDYEQSYGLPQAGRTVYGGLNYRF
jgi:outer membrane cobalamin receptor